MSPDTFLLFSCSSEFSASHVNVGTVLIAAASGRSIKYCMRAGSAAVPGNAQAGTPAEGT